MNQRFTSPFLLASILWSALFGFGAFLCNTSGDPMLFLLGNPHPGTLAELAAIPQIDEGEAVLLNLVPGSPDALFLTGDERVLRGLAEHGVCNRFCGRILILEQILHACLACQGMPCCLPMSARTGRSTRQSVRFSVAIVTQLSTV